MMKQLLALLLLLCTASASVYLVLPVNIVIDSPEPILISPVGPGHEVFLKFQRDTYTGFYWDSVRLVNTVDSDWTAEFSSDHEYLYFSVDVPKDKPSGDYTFEFEISDAQSLMDSQIAVVTVFVTHDPNDLLEVLPFYGSTEFFAASGDAATFRVKNKALSRATYEVTSTMPNLPGFLHSQSVHFESTESKIVYVPLNVPHEGYYNLQSYVWSEDNPTIDSNVMSKIVVKPTLTSKLRSIGSGFPLLPVTMAPFYALLGVLGF